MAIARWNRPAMNPVYELERLKRDINRIFETDAPEEARGLFDRSSSPKLDVIEEQDDFKVYCDLPGVASEDIDVSIANNVLTIKGEKKQPEPADEKDVFRCETWTGRFQRTLSLPATVDSGKISADLSNGLLTVALPKREEVKPRQIKVKVQ